MRCFAIALVFTSTLVFAQHNHPAPKTIDGAVNPQGIPDIVAYRMYFIAVSTVANDPDEAKERQQANFRTIGFRDSDPDVQVLVRELENFKAAYTDMISRYNDEATTATAAGIRPNQQALLAQRDALVTATRNALKQHLSAEGMKAIDRKVQDEKKFMKLTIEEGQ